MKDLNRIATIKTRAQHLGKSRNSLGIKTTSSAEKINRCMFGACLVHISRVARKRGEFPDGGFRAGLPEAHEGKVCAPSVNIPGGQIHLGSLHVVYKALDSDLVALPASAKHFRTGAPCAGLPAAHE